MERRSADVRALPGDGEPGPRRAAGRRLRRPDDGAGPPGRPARAAGEPADRARRPGPGHQADRRVPGRPDGTARVRASGPRPDRRPGPPGPAGRPRAGRRRGGGRDGRARWRRSGRPTSGRRGCGRSGPPSSSSGRSPTYGDGVRIASLLPAATEIVRALGLADQPGRRHLRVRRGGPGALPGRGRHRHPAGPRARRDRRLGARPGRPRPADVRAGPRGAGRAGAPTSSSPRTSVGSARCRPARWRTPAG